MSDIVREVLCEVDRLQDELVELCRALVRVNTVNPYAGGRVTGLERGGQDVLEPVMQALGGRTRRFEPVADIYRRFNVLGPRDRQWTNRPNLVTVFDLGPGPRLILNSHMDTVGVEGMQFDPFCAELRDGRVYGRGASDDKGGLAMGVMAVKAVLKFAESLSGTIIHESVVDEECSGSGAGTLACCLEGYGADEAVVVDGSGLAIIRGCGGCLTAEVSVEGRSGHAARGGVNAIDKAVLVKAGIDEFKRQREAEHPHAQVNLGVFQAGVHPAVVPGKALLGLNLVYRRADAEANERAGKGWNGTLVRERFAAAVAGTAARDTWLQSHPPRVEWIKDLVPFEIPAAAPLVTGLASAYAAALGREPVVDVMSAWADGANLVRHGGIPAVQFGPGLTEAAHADDETVLVQDLVDGTKALAVYLVQRLARTGT